MMGFGHIGQFAIGFIHSGSVTPLVFEPVSRIIAGGFNNERPVQVVFLGVEIMYDSEDIITYDNGDPIAWG